MERERDREDSEKGRERKEREEGLVNKGRQSKIIERRQRGGWENCKLHEKCKMQPQRQLLGKPQAQNGHAHAHKRPLFLLASSATTSRQFLANCFQRVLHLQMGKLHRSCCSKLPLPSVPLPPSSCAFSCYLSPPPPSLTQLNSSSSSRSAITSELQKCVPKYLTDTQILQL